MPITLQEIKDHLDQYGIENLETTPTSVFRQLLDDGAFFWIDHHDFIRSTLSEEIFATNREQLDALIEHLQQFRNKMPAPSKRFSEE